MQPWSQAHCSKEQSPDTSVGLPISRLRSLRSQHHWLGSENRLRTGPADLAVGSYLEHLQVPGKEPAPPTLPHSPV